MTISDLKKCAARELAMRQAVYPRSVRSGKMKQSEADHELEAMKDIADLLDIVSEMTHEDSAVRAHAQDRLDEFINDREEF